MTNSPDNSVLELGVTGSDKLIKTLTIVSKTVKSLEQRLSALKKQGGLLSILSPKGLTQNLTRTNTMTMRIAKSASEIAASNKQAGTAAESLSTNLKGVKEEVEAAADASEIMADNFESIDNLPLDVGDMGGAGGDFRASEAIGTLTAVTGATSQLSTSLESLGTTEDSVLAKTMRAADEFGSLAESASMTIDSVVDMGRGIFNMAGKIRGAEASGAALTAVAGPLAVALAAVTTAFIVYQRELQNAKDMMERQAEVGQQVAETEAELQELRRTGTREEIQSRVQQIEAQRAQQEFVIAGLQQQIDNANAMYAAAEGLGGVIERNLIASNVMPELERQMREASQSAEDAQRQIDMLNGALDDVGAAEDARNAAEALAEAEGELLNVRIEMADALAEYQSNLQSTREGWIQEDQRREEEAQIDRERSQRDFNERIVSMEESAAKERVGIMEELQKSLTDAEQEFADSNADAFTELNKSLLEMDQDLIDSEAELRKNAAEEEVKESESYRRDLLKSETDYQRERLRRVIDANEELINAEMANDVVAFIQAKKQAKKDLKRMDEDHANELAEQSEQFALSQRERRENFQKELADLRENHAKQRAETLANYAEEKAQRALEHSKRMAEMRIEAQERIEENRQQVAEEIASAREERRKELARLQEDLEIQARFREEDREQQLEELQAQSEARLEEISTREARARKVIAEEGRVTLQEIETRERQMRSTVVQSYKDAMSQLSTISSSALSGVSSAIDSVNSAISKVRGTASRFSTGTLSGYATKGSTMGPVTSPRATSTKTNTSTSGNMWDTMRSRWNTLLGAADGAYVRKPTVVLAGEGDYEEVILPVRKSGGVPSEAWKTMGKTLAATMNNTGGRAPNGSQRISFDFSGMTLGEGVSQAFVQQQLQTMGDTVVKALHTARFGQVMA